MADSPVIIFNEGSDCSTLPGTSLNKLSSNSYDASPVLKESLWSIMESYIQYYASGASHTARAKRHDLEHFLGFLARNGKALNDIPVSDWTPEASNQFIEDRLNAGDAPSTVARRLATIKHFGRTLADRVPGFVNPAREAKAPVFEVVRPQGLESDDINLLRDSAKVLQLENPDTFTHFRNRVLLETLLGTGLRADEVRLLKRAQVSDDISWLKHVKTKGKRFRDVYLHTELASLLSDYLAKSRDYIIRNHAGAATWQENIWARIPVFISIKNSVPDKPESFALAPKTLWRIISELGNHARITSSASGPEMPHLHPHKLRHTFAHGLLDTSNDIRLVAQALGHSDVRTTMRYTERYKEELAIAMERRASAERKG